MDVKTAIRTRRSIRKFRAEPVPRELLQEVLSDTRWSPSWGNTQSWKIHVVLGKPLETFREANRRQLLDGASPSTELPMPESWPETLKRRYVGVGKSVLSALGIARDDQAGRLAYRADMASLFFAPCFVLFCADARMPAGYAMMDCGIAVQTFCLLCENRGLGTCILASSIWHPELLRGPLDIPADQTIAVGVAVGYPDLAADVNRFERERAPLGEIVHWRE
jgi:nitroreductase